jgi:hypothetical protein
MVLIISVPVVKPSKDTDQLTQGEDTPIEKSRVHDLLALPEPTFIHGFNTLNSYTLYSLSM